MERMTAKLDKLSDYAFILIQLLGVVLSAFLVVVTYANPTQVEAGLQRFAIAKVTEAADTAWREAGSALAGTQTEIRLTALAEKFGQDSSSIDKQRQEIVPQIVAMALSDECRENCAAWLVVGDAVNDTLVEKAAGMRVGETTLGDFVKEKYDTTVDGLLRDLRRFGLVNVVALSLMALLILTHRFVHWRLKVLSVAITTYSAWASYGYVVQQNWAMSILTQNWAGPVYQASMIFVSILCIDWIFLGGWITQTISSAIAAAIPS